MKTKVLRILGEESLNYKALGVHCLVMVKVGVNETGFTTHHSHEN